MTSAGRSALIVVDVQNDFCEGGSLAVVGGAQVAADVTAYVAEQRDRYELVVPSMDWHRADSTNDGHIALPPDHADFRDTWPAHCVAGTHGAQLHPALSLAGGSVPVRKGWGTAAYSAFQGVAADGRTLPQLLAEAQIDRLVFCGIATDYCVRASVADGARLGFTVDLLVDFTAAVDPTAAGSVVAGLVAQGVRAI